MLWAVAKKNKPLNIEYNNTLQMIHWRNSYLHFEKKLENTHILRNWRAALSIVFITFQV